VLLSLSVPLLKGNRVGTMLVGLQSVGHGVHVCLEGCYVSADVMENSVEPCVAEFLWMCCGWVCQ